MSGKTVRGNEEWHATKVPGQVQIRDIAFTFADYQACSYKLEIGEENEAVILNPSMQKVLDLVSDYVTMGLSNQSVSVLSVVTTYHFICNS